jgi:chromosome partitioning protein
VQTEYLATKNLPELMNLVADVADRANPHIEISALVPNQMKRTALCQQVYEQHKAWDLKDYLPHQVSPLWISPPINQLTLYTELSAQAVPICRYPGVLKRHLEPFEAIAAHLESQFAMQGVA